jgi:hypothetical protein
VLIVCNLRHLIFWAHKKRGRFGEENHGRVYTRKEEEGSTKKKRWAQDITDDLEMSTSDAGHLAYD